MMFLGFIILVLMLIVINDNQVKLGRNLERLEKKLGGIKNASNTNTK